VGFDLFYPSYGAQRALLLLLLSTTNGTDGTPNSSGSNDSSKHLFLESTMSTLSCSNNLSCLFSPMSYSNLKEGHYTDSIPQKDEAIEIGQLLMKVICESIRNYVQVKILDEEDGNWSLDYNECVELSKKCPAVKLYHSILR
jgi:hypothetical protein